MQQFDQDKVVKPFVKWVGGKRRSLPVLMRFVPRRITTYVEPFVGGGAMFFALDFQKAIINDSNSELMSAYLAIRDHLDELKALLRSFKYEKGMYEEIRAWDRDEENFAARPAVEHAARLIYLIKTCFNGLYRVNKNNFFNTPFGKLVNPNICDEPVLDAVHEYLTSRQVDINNISYSELLDKIPGDAFVYLDPPYAPLSTTSSFTSYQPGTWTDDDQRELGKFCDELDRRGIKFMQSNSTAPIIFDIYKKYHIDTLDAMRSINSKGNGRGAIKELVITNYDPLQEILAEGTDVTTPIKRGRGRPRG